MSDTKKRGEIPPEGKRPDRERLIYDVEALRVYFDPVRLKLLHEMIDQPRTVHELADATGMPFTRLYYHMRLLEKHGFIHVVETRIGAGAIEEKYYQVSAYLFVVDRSLLQLGTPAGDAGFSAVQETVFDQTKQDIRQSIDAGLVDQTLFPPHPRALMARREIFRLKPGDAQEFHERLRALIVEFYERGAKGEDALYYNFTVVLYPTLLYNQENATE